jgi:hypothetical protein
MLYWFAVGAPAAAAVTTAGVVLAERGRVPLSETSLTGFWVSLAGAIMNPETILLPSSAPRFSSGSYGWRPSPTLEERDLRRPVSILELIVDLLDGWANARSFVSEPSGDAIARTLKDALDGVRLPETPAESETLLRSLPPLFSGGERPESAGSWARWRSPQGPAPILGVVEVSEVDPGCTTAADLINSLKANEEEWVATGFIGSDGDVITWIVGLATEPAERRHALVFGLDSPMAYVILASTERQLEVVIQAIGSALPRAS